jgi:hypothetical protein
MANNLGIARRSFLISAIGAATTGAVPSEAASSRLGQVATRCWVPQQIDDKNRQFNSRSWHYCRDDATSLQIAFANWYAVGFNLNPNQTADQVLASRLEIASLFKGKNIIETTIYPRTTSTDYWQTTESQAVMKTESARVAINDAIRAGRPGIDHFRDIASATKTRVVHRRRPMLKRCACRNPGTAFGSCGSLA